MKKLLYISIISLLIVGCGNQNNDFSESESEKQEVEIKTFPKQKIEALKAFLLSAETDSTLVDFYSNKNEFVWFDVDLEKNKSAKEFLELLSNSRAYGIDTNRHDLTVIKRLINNDSLIQAECLLTQNFASFGKKICFGQIDDVEDFYKFQRRPVDTNWFAVLNDGLQNQNVIEQLLSLQPSNDEYQRLQKGLTVYLSKVNLSDSTVHVKNYRKDSVLAYQQAQKALKLHGIITSDSISDSLLIQAVKTFQYQHGLEADGVIGKGTARELSRSTNYFYQRAKVALEKLRWMKPFDYQHILVNIGTYKMKCYEENKILHEKRVVVGTNTTRTPELDSKLDYMIAYPYWHVPRSIIEGELVAKAKKDSTYLSRNGYELFKGGSAVNSKTIDWSKGSNYKFRQKGGGYNALGVVKFIFKNKHSVYFHDTPSKRFFKKGRRAYSHGCVRVHEPLQLAEYLIEKDSANQYSIDSVKALIKSRTRKVITFNKKMPVHIRYYTVEADTSNQIRFYPDVYSREKELIQKL